MNTTTKSLIIRRAVYEIEVDPGYGQHLAARFEPYTVIILDALCTPTSRVLDIGANIGVTAIALAQACPRGKIVAIEPVRAAYAMMAENVMRSKHSNIQVRCYALGAEPGEILMQGSPNNKSGSFVADKHSIDDAFHFRETVTRHRLDDVFPSLNLDGLDLIKIDVEGYELDVFAGARVTLAHYRPMVLLEMNYAALNLWREISVPEFRRRLLDIFPFVYAVQQTGFVDFRNERGAHDIMAAHLHSWAYMDLVAGYDRDRLSGCLSRMPDIFQKNEAMYAATLAK